MLDLLAPILSLTVKFILWYIFLSLLIVVITAVILRETEQCKKICEETNVNKLKEQRDVCEAVNNIFNGVYLTFLGCFLSSNKNLWTNILIVVALMAILVLAVVLQRRLYTYKKRIREIE